MSGLVRIQEQPRTVCCVRSTCQWFIVGDF
jgi:hypothetical protein